MAGKDEGDKVTAGDVIAEIETDKATMEVEAVDEGMIAKILIEEGTEASRSTRHIAVIAEEGEDASSLTAAASSKPAPAPAAAPRNRCTGPAAKGPAAAPAARQKLQLPMIRNCRKAPK